MKKKSVTVLDAGGPIFLLVVFGGPIILITIFIALVVALIFGAVKLVKRARDKRDAKEIKENQGNIDLPDREK